jgi:hypothetical protein
VVHASIKRRAMLIRGDRIAKPSRGNQRASAIQRDGATDNLQHGLGQRAQ